MELAAEWLFFEVFLKCGKPNHLIFDTQFDVIEVNSILKVLSILGSKSWSYVHNGVAAERIIKFLLEAIRTMVSFAKSKTGINMNHLAPNLFYYAMAAYNSSPIPGTNGITPFFQKNMEDITFCLELIQISKTSTDSKTCPPLAYLNQLSFVEIYF